MIHGILKWISDRPKQYDDIIVGIIGGFVVWALLFAAVILFCNPICKGVVR